MNPDPTTQASKRLSWLLRHGANEAGVAMDAAGWCAVDDVLRVVGLTREQLEHVVRENNKSRLELDGPRVRASQGHSLAGTPVTLDALEASWQRLALTGSVWHGTHPDAVRGIAREGIHAAARTHVHLTRTLDSRVGKRAGVDVMLEVSTARLETAGLGLFASPNDVVLVRRVPREAIVGLVALTARGRREADALRALYGFAAHGA